jgi:hypothetical protein
MEVYVLLGSTTIEMNSLNSDTEALKKTTNKQWIPCTAPNQSLPASAVYLFEEGGGQSWWEDGKLSKAHDNHYRADSNNDDGGESR